MKNKPRDKIKSVRKLEKALGDENTENEEECY